MQKANDKNIAQETLNSERIQELTRQLKAINEEEKKAGRNARKENTIELSKRKKEIVNELERLRR